MTETQIAYYLHIFVVVILSFLCFTMTITLILVVYQLISSHLDKNDEDCEQQWDQILQSAMPLTQQPNFCEEISSE